MDELYSLYNMIFTLSSITAPPTSSKLCSMAKLTSALLAWCPIGITDQIILRLKEMPYHADAEKSMPRLQHLLSLPSLLVILRYISVFNTMICGVRIHVT